MLFTDNRWILAGITSYGVSCALADHPGVYTRTSYYNNWVACFLLDNSTCIEENVQKRTFVFSEMSLIYMQNIFSFCFSYFCLYCLLLIVYGGV